MARHQRSLAFQIGFVTAAVALVAVALTTAVSVALVHSAVSRSAHRRLARDADLVASLSPRAPGNLRSRHMLIGMRIKLAVLSPQGVVRGDLTVPAADQTALLGGTAISGDRTIDGAHLLVEGRPLAAGGAIELAESAGLPRSTTRAIQRAELLALAVGLIGGVSAGVVLARRVARPLRATAQGARLIAAGDRSVQVAPEGPAEVAAVTHAFNELSSALATSEQRQRDFLLSVSHELRTPLTAILGYSEALADGVTPPEDVPATGATMLAEAIRLNRLVSDLLDLARLGADEFPVDFVESDLRVLVADAADVWRHRCEQEGIELRVELPSDPILVMTDPTRVRQIIDGLAENAVRVTPAGRPVVLSLAPTTQGARIELRDGGPGLTDDDLRVAFDRSALYNRYRGVRRVGTGLGLALVHALTARLAGEAHAGHAPEGGARFWIDLPAGPTS